MTMFTCPMHPEVQSDKPGKCPKCGMTLVETNNKMAHEGMEHGEMKHKGHVMKKVSEMSFWEKLKMGMGMTMGMDHTGLAGAEMAKLMEEDIKHKFFFSLFLTIPIILYSPFGAAILHLNLPSLIPVNWLLFILTTPVFFFGGWLFLYSSYHEIKNRNLGMSVLIAVGISAAYLFSIVLTLLGSTDSFYEAAAMLITFVLFGHWMEMKSRRGTTDALQALFNLVPPQARVLRDGKEILVPTPEVKLGDILILKPGDKVPVDGEIIFGETSIDESLVTGESLPVSKSIGDMVVGGSINQTGSVNFKATKIGQDTVLAQIVKMVETAQNSKAPGQKLADKFAKYLVFLAVGSGFLTFIVWFFIAGQPLMLALTFAISAVVIACPDALGLATPTAVAVGTGLGAKHNILIKDAPTLEQVSKIQTIVLDKTGTLTEGKPKVTEVTGKDTLQIAASLEKLSNHPLAKAIIDEAEKQKLKLLPVTGFESLAGKGIQGKINGKEYFVGKNESSGIVVSSGNQVLGTISVVDTIKPNAKVAIDKMKQLGIEVAMITGDNKKTAEEIGKQLGIERIFSEVLPQDKEKYIKKLQDEGKFVAMVGDGVNDAPALAQADIGIAIGAGTDVAIETANVVLMKSDPLDILRAIKLSKATVRKMKENLFWASIYNLLAIPIAAGILYPKFGITLRPEVSALLMSLSSIIVATNAVLLKRTEKDLINI